MITKVKKAAIYDSIKVEANQIKEIEKFLKERFSHRFIDLKIKGIQFKLNNSEKVKSTFLLTYRTNTRMIVNVDLVEGDYIVYVHDKRPQELDILTEKQYLKKYELKEEKENPIRLFEGILDKIIFTGIQKDNNFLVNIRLKNNDGIEYLVKNVPEHLLKDQYNLIVGPNKNIALTGIIQKQTIYSHKNLPVEFIEFVNCLVPAIEHSVICNLEPIGMIKIVEFPIKEKPIVKIIHYFENNMSYKHALFNIQNVDDLLSHRPSIYDKGQIGFSELINKKIEYQLVDGLNGQSEAIFKRFINE